MAVYGWLSQKDKPIELAYNDLFQDEDLELEFAITSKLYIHGTNSSAEIKLQSRVLLDQFRFVEVRDFGRIAKLCTPLLHQ